MIISANNISTNNNNMYLLFKTMQLWIISTNNHLNLCANNKKKQCIII